VIIDPALKLMIEAVRRCDSYIVQSPGDRIFALFGGPSHTKTIHSARFTRPLRLQEAMRRYSATLDTRSNQHGKVLAAPQNVYTISLYLDGV